MFTLAVNYYRDNSDGSCQLPPLFIFIVHACFIYKYICQWWHVTNIVFEFTKTFNLVVLTSLILSLNESGKCFSSLCRTAKMLKMRDANKSPKSRHSHFIKSKSILFAKAHNVFCCLERYAFRHNVLPRVFGLTAMMPALEQVARFKFNLQSLSHSLPSLTLFPDRLTVLSSLNKGITSHEI